jgi:hypothetical protein
VEAPNPIREARTNYLLTAAGAGAVAALAGGVIWGLIGKWTNYEVGVAAWGIGFIVGTAVVFGARGPRGLPLQLMAVVLALAGVLIGKYLSFVWANQEDLEKLGISLPVFSGDTVDLFMDDKSDVWSGWDLLWVGLAVVTAFRIPQPEREEEAPPAKEPVAEDDRAHGHE